MSNDNAPSVLEAALSYVKAGIHVTPLYGPKVPAVGIVTDPGKQPKLKGWQTRRLSEDECKKAFKGDDNLGVVTGKASRLLCVDCDKRSGGMEWYAMHEMELGSPIREATPSGGLHLYYAYPKDRDFVPSENGLFPGVDFLADGGKQVATWPSIHKDGGMYAIQNGLNLEDALDEAGPIPPWILETADRAYAEKKKWENVGKDATDLCPGVTVDSPQEILRCVEALSYHPPAIQGDHGDYTTLKAAHLCRDFGLSQMKVFKVLKEHYNPRCKPLWSDDRLKGKVKNAFKYAQHPRGKRTRAVEVLEFPDDLEAVLKELPPAKPSSRTEEIPDPEGYKLKLPVVSARYFISRHPGKLLCHQSQMHVYREKNLRWEMVNDDDFEAIILRDISTIDPKAYQHVKMSQLRDVARAIKRELQPDAPDELHPDTWTNGLVGEFVSCNNGIVEVETGDVLPHSPEWFSFTTLPFDYVPGAGCPEFMRFLDSVWDGDMELISALQLWMGYVLITPMRDQKFAVLIGESRGGKSTLARVMEAMVGRRNTAACSILQFGSEFGLEPVLGKKLAVFSDAEKVTGLPVMVATERLKCITGNDPITVNRKNKSMLNDVSFPTKVMLVCNQIPPFVNNQGALTNRMIAFPFRKTFMGKEDVYLLDRLMGELPGVLNWSILGAKRLLQGERLQQATAGARAVDEIAEILDSVRGFISDAVEFRNDTSARSSFVSCKSLYDAYKSWCRDSNAGQYGKKRFFQEFKSKAGDRVVANRLPGGARTRGYYGVRLDPDLVSDFSAVGDAEPEDADDDMHF